MTTKERKIKPPDDPTQMVGGRPKISINANKLQINEFLKRNKKSLNPSIQRTAGGKAKSLDVLRKELEEGGHFVGVKDTKNTSSRGAKTSKANIEKQEKEEKYKQLITANPQGFNVKNINTISLMGFTKETFVPPAPSQGEIAMSGFGGMPVPDELQEKVKTKLPGITEMRDFLATRVPMTVFKNMGKAEMYQLYLKNKGITPVAPEKIGVSDIRDYLATRIPTENFKGLTKKELREIYDLEKAKDYQGLSPSSDTDTDSEDEGETDEQMAEKANEENPGERVDIGEEEEYNGDLFQKFYFDGTVYFIKGDYDVYENGGLGDDPVGVWNEEDEDIDDFEDAYRRMGDEEIREDGFLYEDFVLHPRFGDDTTYWTQSEIGAKFDRTASEKIYDSPGGQQVGTMPAGIEANREQFIQSPLEQINLLFNKATSDPISAEVAEEEEFPDGGGWGSSSEDEDDIEEEEDEKVLFDFEGSEYFEDEDTGKVYNPEGDHVADWNEDVDDLIWTKEKYKLKHELNRP